MSDTGNFHPVCERGNSSGGHDPKTAGKTAKSPEPDFGAGTALEPEEAGQQGLSDVLHELRATLTAVLGYAKLLDGERAGPINATQRRYVRVILENSRRTMKTLDSLSECDAKRGRRSELVDFGGLWSESVRLTRPRAAIKGIRIVERPREGRLMVCGDPNDLAFATHKVLTNAVRATAAGGTIEVAMARDRAEVTARITNAACGVAGDAQATLLGCGRWSGCPSQAEADSALQGMPLVHDIIETHAGRIWSAGSPESGWTLALSLPAADCDA